MYPLCLYEKNADLTSSKHATCTYAESCWLAHPFHKPSSNACLHKDWQLCPKSQGDIERALVQGVPSHYFISLFGLALNNPCPPRMYEAAHHSSIVGLYATGKHFKILSHLLESRLICIMRCSWGDIRSVAAWSSHAPKGQGQHNMSNNDKCMCGYLRDCQEDGVWHPSSNFNGCTLWMMPTSKSVMEQAGFGTVSQSVNNFQLSMRTLLWNWRSILDQDSKLCNKKRQHW